MPHKHKRDEKANQSSFELPPNTVARPLPVSKARPSNANGEKAVEGQKRNRKRKQSKQDAADDTPRAFVRLMAFQKGVKPRSGLDDGMAKSKKRKRDDEENSSAAKQPAKASDIPKILPGERMTDYSARVDAALPLAGLLSKGRGKDIPGVKTQQTRTERKLQRMQKEWREVDARYKERLQEAMEEAEGEDEETGIVIPLTTTSKKKGKRRKGGGNGDNDDDDDPWAAVGKARKEQQASAGLVGLHDVVQAPPQFSKVPKEKFKVRQGAKIDVLDVPSAAGSLRRREELGVARRSVVEGYRQLMKERRESAPVK